MAEKLRDIKETASDAVEIIRELGSPEVQESLEKIREVAKTVRDIIVSLEDPAMMANIENMRKITESVENTSARTETITTELRKAGVLDEAREKNRSAKGASSSIRSVGEANNRAEP